MQISKSLGLLLPVILTCAGADIVKNGKPCADIVIAQNADTGVRLAAKDLQKHLQLISGAKLAVVTPDKVKASSVICVGESSVSSKAGYKMPAFKTSGYDIWVKGNCVVLNGPVTLQTNVPVTGTLHPVSVTRTLLSENQKNAELGVSLADDCGPMHAVSAFLEHLGVRFYAPYKEGTVIPRLGDIKVGDFRETREAAFGRREYLMGGAQAEDAEAVLWFKRLKTGSSLPPVGVLALADVIKAGEKFHPEWAARGFYGQKMLTSDGCLYPRFIDKHLQKTAAAAAKKYFDANPQVDTLHIVPPALRGLGDYGDENAVNPKNHYPVPTPCNILARFYISIAKEIAKSHPGKKILWQGLYNKNVFDDPTAVPGNMKAALFSQSPLLYVNASASKGVLGQHARLAEIFKTNDLQLREWWNEYGFSQLARQPYFFPRSLQAARQTQKPLLAGFLFDTAVDKKTQRLAEIPLIHFMYYVNSKLLWDPDLDLAALTDEYCRLWYGPAAEEMKSLMSFCESVSSRGPRVLSELNGEMTAEDIALIFELLEKAEKKTAAKTVYRSRVTAVKKGLSGLKDAFVRMKPAGKTVTAEVLPWNTPCDLKLNKFKNWMPLPDGGKGVRTEYAIAFAEGRKNLWVAFRCYEPEMKKLRSKASVHDDERIFSGDHIRIDLSTGTRSNLVAAVDCAGLFYDGSTDWEELAITGSSAGRDRELTQAAVRRFADRWEVMMSIDVQGCGRAPGLFPPWGLNITRVRTVSGSREEFSLVKDAGNVPEKWCQLTVPPVDSQGREITPYNGVARRIFEDAPVETGYMIKRAKGKVALSDPWDGGCWKDVPELRLGWENISFGLSSGYCSDARAKLQYDDKYIYVLYNVKDRSVRGNFKQDQGMVCLDSCAELFIRPDRNAPYYNFECNCIGTLLLYEIHVIGARKKMVPVTPEELKSIKRFSTLPRNLKGEIEGPLTWRLGLRLPIEFFVKRTGVSPQLSGQVWQGNIYKCADWTSRPAWLSWKKTTSYHNPECFGTFIFE